VSLKYLEQEIATALSNQEIRPALAQVLRNGIFGNWDSTKKPLTGKPTYQDLSSEVSQAHR
jgi:hypothetical protein